MALSAGPRAGRDLSLEQRIEAQRSIERVYYSHQTGATRSFEEAVPRELLERKVRTYLKQSAALDHLWKTPVTAQALRAELERIAAQTQLPDRLSELYAALGNDPFMIQECLARPILVDRLSRSFFAADERVHGRGDAEAERLREPEPEISWEKWWREAQDDFDERAVPAVAAVGGSLPAPVHRAAGPTGWEARLGLSQPSQAVPQAAEGCVEEDGWDDGLRYDVPGQRYSHSAVWTGSQMIVWGGLQGREDLPTNTGARYDPATDTWAPMSVIGAPDPSEAPDHTAVWTGREMIVFTEGPDRLTSRTGRRYDPVSDAWMRISVLNAPEPSYGHSAIWTGKEMVVWGGVALSCGEYVCHGGLTNTGGRYDPETDTWRPTSTVGAPSPRSGHTAVWTGSEMIVWGDSYGLAQTGGRYDPTTDTWAPTTVLNSPPPLESPSAVWIGSDMFVWGRNGLEGAGGRYSPASDTWTEVSTQGAPPARNQTAVWTGHRVLVWSGGRSGGRYDPGADAWEAISITNAPVGFFHSAIWTGSVMVVLGGFSPGGARYDPVTDTWTPTSRGRQAGIQTPMGNGSVVWTGSLVVVWGGYDGYDWFSSGGRYDPVTDSWTATSNAPDERAAHSAIWTGDLMVVWGGDNRIGGQDDGFIYDPARDAWSWISIPEWLQGRLGSRAVSAGRSILVSCFLPASSARHCLYNSATDTWTPISAVGAPISLNAPAVWTGQEVVFLSAPSSPGSVTSGNRYNPETDVWTHISGAGAPGLGYSPVAEWTGEEVVVWGWRFDGERNVSDGGRYDPATDSWEPISLVGAPSLRFGTSAVWSGTEMIVWGGGSNTGARYAPTSDSWMPTSTVNAPPLRGGSAVWTDNAMLVWGLDRLSFGGRYYPVVRRDGDADGFTACEGDCNEADAAINPEGVELPGNPIDEDCDGVVACDPGAGWKNRGQLLSCVTRECHAAVSAGRLSKETCRALVDAAGSSATSGARR